MPPTNPMTILRLVNNVLVAIDEQQNNAVTTIYSSTPSVLNQIRGFIREGLTYIPSWLPNHPEFRAILTKTPSNGIIDLTTDEVDASRVLAIEYQGRPVEFKGRTRYTVYVDSISECDVIYQTLIAIDGPVNEGIPINDFDVFPWGDELATLLQQYVIYRTKAFLGQGDASVSQDVFQAQLDALKSRVPVRTLVPWRR